MQTGHSRGVLLPNFSPSTTSSSTYFSGEEGNGPTRLLSHPVSRTLSKKGANLITPGHGQNAATKVKATSDFRESLGGSLSEEELRDRYYEYWERKQRSTHHQHYSSNGSNHYGAGTIYSQTHHHHPVASNGSARGSQAALVVASASSSSASSASAERSKRAKWPKGKDFLFATWAYVIGAHSLWELPILVLRYGGVVFVLVYLIMFLVLGVPMLLLEMTLGQYSALSPTKFFRNLCPALTGVGFAVALTLLVHAMCDFAAVTWASQAMFVLFSDKETQDDFFYSKVLGVSQEANGVGLSLGALQRQLTLCLAIACIIIFVFVAASTKSIGKISLLLVPASYGLLMTLTIRGFMAPGGPAGVVALLSPNWSHISSPWTWFEASRSVFLSLQLGMGVVTTYASYNKYHYNIIRDAGIISIGHFVWSILCCLLVFSFLGVADHAHRVNLDNVTDPDGTDLFVRITGRNLWLLGVTLAESAAGSLEYPWLWAGLLFILVVLSAAAGLAAAAEVIAACAADEWPRMRRYRPAVAFTALAVAFLAGLVMTTQGGVHVYYLLTAYYAAQWPALLVGLFTLLAAAFGHGGKYLMKDLGDMSKMPLSHYFSAHLSVLYATVLPVVMTATLAWGVYKVSLEHVEAPLVNFSMGLPLGWGMPLGWCIACLPVLFTLIGFAFNLLWKSKGIPFPMHLSRSLKPTDVWYENEHRELMQLETLPKDSPILAYKRGIATFTPKNITEV